MDALEPPFDPSTPLGELIDLAVPICRMGEASAPPRGPGRPFEIPDRAFAVLVLIALAKRLDTKSSQYRFLAAHSGVLVRRLGLERFPARSTYFARYRSAHAVLGAALAAHTAHAAKRRHVEVRCAAADRTLIAAAGPVRHPERKGRRGRKGRRRRGIDDEAAWSRSTRGWVYGFGLEVIVSAPADGVVWPMLASVDPANVREARTLPPKLPRLPGRTRYLLVDAGYDGNDLADALERDADGAPTGRRMIGPQQRRHNRYGGRKREWRESRRRRDRRARREKRRAFFDSKFGRSLYKRRGKTVEPFFGRFKSLFGLDEHARHRGLDNNRTRLLGALLLYQILLVYNRIKGRRDAEVKWILDAI